VEGFSVTGMGATWRNFMSGRGAKKDRYSVKDDPDTGQCGKILCSHALGFFVRH